MKIYIPYDFPSWNQYISAERTNRYIAAKLKKEEKEAVWACCHGKVYKGKYPVHLIVKVYPRDKRRDLDGYRIKGLLDGLVNAKVITDDNLNYIQKITMIPIFGTNMSGVEVEIKEMR